MNKDELIISIVVVLILVGGIAAVLIHGGRKDEENKIANIIPEEGELQIEEIKEGEGDVISVGEGVVLNYKAKVMDGDEFENTYDSGNPVNVEMGFSGQLIAGLEQGLDGMKKGGKRRLTIPWNLGYGADGNGSTVGEYETLEYEVEISEVFKPGELKVEVTKKGDGDEVKSGDNIKANYTGKLTDGTKFDSSLDEGRDPFEFTVGQGQVIQGWDQGFVGLKVGDKATFTIPWNLGYGSTGSGENIPPFSTLIFEVEVLEILESAGE